MLPQSSLDIFSINGRKFETSGGQVTARVINTPDAPPAHGGFTDQRPFMIEFSGGRKLTLVLSHASLHLDETQAYHRRAFEAVDRWLTHGGPERVEMFT